MLADWRADRPAGPAGWRTWRRRCFCVTEAGGGRAISLAHCSCPTHGISPAFRYPSGSQGWLPTSRLKLAHDLAMLPLARGWRGLRQQVGRARDRLAGHEAALALLPMSAEERLLWKRRQAVHAAARRAVAADPDD